MSFNTGLSALRAASKEMDVTGNNISNVATTGFKSSRGEFADVYSAVKLGSTRTAIGSGVRLANVSQQFTQGAMRTTGNVLDMAIQETVRNFVFGHTMSKRCMYANQKETASSVTDSSERAS